MTDAELERLQQRFDRERRARLDAEAIAERATAELYEAVRDLERTNDVLESANRSMRDFVAIASHDLRGPLAGILGFASTLLERWDAIPDGERHNFVGAIDRQGRHLLRIVEDLLTVSRIEAGAMEAHVEEISVARLLDQIAMEFAERSSEFSVSCPPDLTVRADPDHLRRIVVNYLTNAFNYGKPPVQTNARIAGDWVEVRVCDHGDGVPSDFIPRLFDKFARAQSGRDAGGTGLGLSIVQGLATMNGGEAWYEPRTPKGSCFAVRLPADSVGRQSVNS